MREIERGKERDEVDGNSSYRNLSDLPQSMVTHVVSQGTVENTAF